MVGEPSGEDTITGGLGFGSSSAMAHYKKEMLTSNLNIIER